MTQAPPLPSRSGGTRRSQSNTAQLDLTRVAYALPAEAVLRQQEVSCASGLAEQEAALRLKRHGPNTLLAHAERTSVSILADQLKSPVVWLLSAAAAVAALFGQWTEATAILLVLVINTLIGFVTELRAIRSMEALRKLGSRSSRVRREGRLKTIAAEEVVPGDIVVLESGDVVTADIRLVQAKNLFCDEFDPDRRIDARGEEHRTGRGGRHCRRPDLDGAQGHGHYARHRRGRRGGDRHGHRARVDHKARDRGRARRLSARAQARGAHRQLVKATLLVTALIAMVGMAAGRDLVLMIEAGIALAVAAIPEGLPIVATMALARGMWRMARRNVVVERLAAVETLGATTLICTDKTGTLTENRMTAERLWLPSARLSDRPQSGQILDAGGNRLRLTRHCGERSRSAFSAAPRRSRLATTAARATRWNLRCSGSASLPESIGEALLAAWPERHEIAFDTETKMMATAHQRDGRLFVAVKGAPEAVLAAATRSERQERLLAEGSAQEWLQPCGCARRGRPARPCARREDIPLEAVLTTRV